MLCVVCCSPFGVCCLLFVAVRCSLCVAVWRCVMFVVCVCVVCLLVVVRNSSSFVVARRSLFAAVVGC